MDAQFESFRAQLDGSSALRDRIRAVVSEVESASRAASAALLLIHQPVPLSDVLGKAKAQVEVIKGLYSQLAEILKECPDQYYRYHGDWKSETQSVVSMLAFTHWLENGGLLTHAEAQEKLGLGSGEFGLDVEDYLTGLCFMSNDFICGIRHIQGISLQTPHSYDYASF
ncbi:Translin [Triticum urartu]|uniref:Translin n=1 Tax=Triticum urartu TaxID=4572 RepID=M7ZJQ8_TRIUA|nr:Translin [Triticum urartu]